MFNHQHIYHQWVVIKIWMVYDWFTHIKQISRNRRTYKQQRHTQKWKRKHYEPCPNALAIFHALQEHVIL